MSEADDGLKNPPTAGDNVASGEAAPAKTSKMDPAVATTMHGGDEATTTHGVAVNGDIANGGAIPELPSVAAGDNGEALSKAMEAVVAVDSTPGTVKGDDTETVAGIVAEAGARAAVGIDAPAFTTPATAAVAMDSQMGSKANLETNSASTKTKTSPSPKNLYSIFASKTPSKSPILTPLGKPRSVSNMPPAGKDSAVATKTPIDAKLATSSTTAPYPESTKPFSGKDTTVATRTPSEASTDTKLAAVTVNTSSKTIAKDTYNDTAADTAPPNATDATPGVSSSVVSGAIETEARTAGAAVDFSSVSGSKTFHAGEDLAPPSSTTSPSTESTAYQGGSRDAVVVDAQATDALAAEALDATDGAFLTVADAIEAGRDSVTPSGFDPHGSTAKPTGSKLGFPTASKANFLCTYKPQVLPSPLLWLQVCLSLRLLPQVMHPLLIAPALPILWAGQAYLLLQL